jgi:hypothetical protein
MTLWPDRLVVSWQELREIKVVMEEVAEEFGGEDPVRPDTRQEIDDALEELRELREQLAFVGSSSTCRRPTRKKRSSACDSSSTSPSPERLTPRPPGAVSQWPGPRWLDLL